MQVAVMSEIHSSLTNSRCIADKALTKSLKLEDSVDYEPAKSQFVVGDTISAIFLFPVYVRWMVMTFKDRYVAYKENSVRMRSDPFVSTKPQTWLKFYSVKA